MEGPYKFVQLVRRVQCDQNSTYARTSPLESGVCTSVVGPISRLDCYEAATDAPIIPHDNPNAVPLLHA